MPAAASTSTIFRTHRHLFIVMAFLFVVETGFAWYRLHHVSTAAGTAYYVSDFPVHLPVLVIIVVVVTMSWAYLSPEPVDSEGAQSARY